MKKKIQNSEIATVKTIDMFSGKTMLQEQQEIASVALEEFSDSKGAAEPIEVAADRYRSQAFLGQEWTSKHFGVPEHSGREFRLSVKGGWAYLEYIDSANGSSYHYAGVMFKESSLPKIADVIVPAARDYIKRSK